MTITVTLTREQEERLEAEVAAGRFASVDAAIGFAINHLVPSDTTDLSWAKPYIDEARASLARGEGIPAEQVFAEIDERLKRRGA